MKPDCCGVTLILPQPPSPALNPQIGSRTVDGSGAVREYGNAGVHAAADDVVHRRQRPRLPQEPHSPFPPRRAHGTLQPQDESVIVGYYTSAEVFPRNLCFQKSKFRRYFAYGKRRRY